MSGYAELITPPLKMGIFTIYLKSALSFPMGKIEFPSTPIGAKKTVSLTETTSDTSPFHQATFAELDFYSTPEIELGNCLITSAVTFRKRVKGNEWQCHISVEPDLMLMVRSNGDKILKME
jgi:hypothetical protein